MEGKSNRVGKRLDGLVVPAMVGLVGLACFGLGRLSVTQPEVPRLVINQGGPGQGAQAAVGGGANPVSHEATQGGRNFVASKSGSKYYLPACSGVSRIKEENKVWFDSATEAEAAGYGPAANCPGL